MTTRSRVSGRQVAAAIAVLLATPLPVAPEPAPTTTRPPALAGAWYPLGRAHIVSAGHFLMRLAAGAPTPREPPLVLLVPHAAWNYSGLAAAAAYRLLEPGDADRVVVVGPSHQGTFTGYALGEDEAWETPLGRVAVCEGSKDVLLGEHAATVPGVSATEHAIEVQLPFLQVALGRFCVVPVLAGDTTPSIEQAFAERLARLDDGRTLFVFSTDFLHYGPRYDFTPYGALSPATLDWIRELDRRAIARVEDKDAAGFRSLVAETRATICGRHAVSTMLELLPRVAPGASPTLLAHQLSADLPSAQDDSSVSYVALAFARGDGDSPPSANGDGPASPPLTTVPDLASVGDDAPPVDEEEGARLVRLARATLRSELLGTSDLDRELASWPEGGEELVRRGVFVSLYEKTPQTAGRPGSRPLRGCIGQAVPVLPLFYGTVQAAVDAALNDARFLPVTAAQLPDLEVEVTVLWPRRPIDSWQEIRLGRDGIILEKGDHSALFLPQAAVEIGSLEQVLSALAEKAGLPADGWRSGARFFVFRGQAFAEGR